MKHDKTKNENIYSIHKLPSIVVELRDNLIVLNET